MSLGCLESGILRDCLQPKFKKHQHCMVWAAIGKGYKSELFFWDHKAHKTMTAQRYLVIILPIVKEGYYNLF